VGLSAHNMLVGAGIGGLVGFGASTLFLLAPSGGDGPPAALGFIIYAPIFTAAGLATGAFLGSTHRTELWSPLYPDIADASMIVGPSGHRGFAFGLSVPYDVPVTIDDDLSDSLGPGTAP
jgi:hypothetical protein